MEQDYIKVNREAYDTFAPQHAKRSEVVGKYNITDEQWCDILSKELLSNKENNLILEIGPGTGRMLEIFENKLNCRTIAVELSKNMISYAREKSPNTVFIEDNILDINFSDESFDAIFMGALIHNFPEKDVNQLLELVYKWLKKSGKALIYTTIHEKSEEGYYVKEDYSGEIVRFRKKFTEKELRDTLLKHNFDITYVLHTEEPDRNKKWLTCIIQKRD